MRDQDDFAPNVEQSVILGIKRLRSEQGMTQSELSEAMSRLGFKFHQATVYKIENGERKVTAAECYALAQVFDVGMEELFTPSSTPEAVARRIRTVADRMGQAILALDEICLRIRSIHWTLFGLSTEEDVVMQGPDGKLTSVDEYLEGFRAFNLHNEVLERLRQEVWADPKFSELMADLTGVLSLVELSIQTDLQYAGFDLPREVDPIALVRSAPTSKDEH